MPVCRHLSVRDLLDGRVDGCEECFGLVAAWHCGVIQVGGWEGGGGRLK